MSLEKIVDMPLITPFNLISAMQKSKEASMALEKPAADTVKTPEKIALLHQKPTSLTTPTTYKHSNLTLNEPVKKAPSSEADKRETEESITVERVKWTDEGSSSNRPTTLLLAVKDEQVNSVKPLEMTATKTRAEALSSPEVEPRMSFLHGTSVEAKARPSLPKKPMMRTDKRSSSAGELLSTSSLHNGTCELANGKSFLQILKETKKLMNQKFSGDSMDDKSDEPIFLSFNKRDTRVAKKEADEDSEESVEDVKVAKRMAPRPPVRDEEPLTVSSLFARKPGANLKSDSPVVREKEKRERASSCSPKFRKANPTSLEEATSSLPASETSPRRNISLSQDSLAAANASMIMDGKDEKKRGRSKFSLKRFLRMGSKKDIDMTQYCNSSGRLEEIPCSPQPKPRLEIIHPLRLDGSVEVVSNDKIAKTISDDRGLSRSPALNSQQSNVKVSPRRAPTGKFSSDRLLEINMIVSR